MAPAVESPEWWLERLYGKLRKRLPQLQRWDDWYDGKHPTPIGYPDSEALMERLHETLGLNMLAVVTNASLGRQQITGFRKGGESHDELWKIWQSNNMGLGSRHVQQEKQILSAAYVLVDPNTPNFQGHPTVTPEHPEQAITEAYPGEPNRWVGHRAYLDDIEGVIRAQMFMDDGTVHAYAAPTRVTQNWRLTQGPQWEYQETQSGDTDLGECALVPFLNHARLRKEPVPEFEPAIRPQKRLNKSLLDRMAMQDQGAFKEWWATALELEVDPTTGKKKAPFKRDINKMLVNENPDGKFGQMEAEDIKQMLEAVREDIIACAIAVPTPPDQFLGQLVNVAEGGLLVAQSSLITRVKDHHQADAESWDHVKRRMLRGAGLGSPADHQMETVYASPEFRTDSEKSQAGITARAAGVPDEVVWQRYFDASPDDAKKWTTLNDEHVRREAAEGVKAVRDAAQGRA